MKIAFFSAKPYDRRFFEAENEAHGNEIVFIEANLRKETAVLARPAEAVCAFVNDVFARLTTFPNVLITGHQAFFTREAMSRIAQTSLANLRAFAAGEECPNELKG